jgi:hypothetical protein
MNDIGSALERILSHLDMGNDHPRGSLRTPNSFAANDANDPYFEWTPELSVEVLRGFCSATQTPFAVTAAQLAHRVVASAFDEPTTKVKSAGDDQGIILALRASYVELCNRAAKDPLSDPLSRFWNPARVYAVTDNAFWASPTYRLELPIQLWREAFQTFGPRVVKLIDHAVWNSKHAPRPFEDVKVALQISSELAAGNIGPTVGINIPWPTGRDDLAASINSSFGRSVIARRRPHVVALPTPQTRESPERPAPRPHAESPHAFLRRALNGQAFGGNTISARLTTLEREHLELKLSLAEINARYDDVTRLLDEHARTLAHLANLAADRSENSSSGSASPASSASLPNLPLD